jgi:hypothetical protein
MEAIANRRCYQCDWEYDRNLAIAELRMGEIRDERQRNWEYGRDLAIKPAIIQFENGEFQGLLCFPCRYRLDDKNDQANDKKFKAEEQLYDKQYAEWQSRCNKEYSEWQSQYGDQWEAQQKNAKKSDETNFLIGGLANVVAVVTFLIIAYLVFESSNKWDSQERFMAVFFAATISASVARHLAKEAASGLFNKPAASSVPKPPEMSLEKNPPPQPRPEPQPPEKRALCGYPELLFDCNKEADLNLCFVQLELFVCNEEAGSNLDFVNFEYDYPPDWDKRANKCKQRDERRCVLCGKKKNLIAHHVIPRAKGGNHSLQNLVTLCKRCHEDQKYYDHKIPKFPV